jgi:hypothetical protein
VKGADPSRPQQRASMVSISASVATRMTCSPFLAHFVSNFLNMQVHLWPPEDHDFELPFEVRFEPRTPQASRCR